MSDKGQKIMNVEIWYIPIFTFFSATYYNPKLAKLHYKVCL